MLNIQNTWKVRVANCITISRISDAEPGFSDEVDEEQEEEGI